MKKTILLCLAFCLLSANAGAQVFDHLSVGVPLSTDGLSIELAAPIGKNVDIRAGFGSSLGLIGITAGEIQLPEHPAVPNSTSVDIPLQVGLGMSNAKLLFNIYPWAAKGFHFTVGTYLGSPRFARATLTGVPADYNTLGIEVDGYLVTAKDGELAAELCASGLGGPSFAVKPYVGIGFGRAVDPDKRISFSFDLGVQYQGKLGLWTYGESTSGQVQKVQLTREHIEDVIEIIDEIGKYTTFWPTLSLHLYVNLF